jgi:hypothetical protein
MTEARPLPSPRRGQSLDLLSICVLVLRHGWIVIGEWVTGALLWPARSSAPATIRRPQHRSRQPDHAPDKPCDLGIFHHHPVNAVPSARGRIRATWCQRLRWLDETAVSSKSGWPRLLVKGEISCVVRKMRWPSRSRSAACHRSPAPQRGRRSRRRSVPPDTIAGIVASRSPGRITGTVPAGTGVGRACSRPLSLASPGPSVAPPGTGAVRRHRRPVIPGTTTQPSRTTHTPGNPRLSVGRGRARLEAP